MSSWVIKRMNTLTEEFLLEEDPFRLVTHRLAAKRFDGLDTAMHAFKVAGLNEDRWAIVPLTENFADGRPTDAITDVSSNLTALQRGIIEEEAIQQVLEDATNDPAYLRNIVTQWVEAQGTLEQCAVIAGGSRHITGEVLGFDPVTGNPV